METVDETDDAEEESNALAQAMFMTMFDDATISVTLHAPKILSSSGETNPDQTTTSWSMPLVDLMDKDFKNQGFIAEFTLQ